MGARRGNFCFSFSRTQENAFPGAFLRFAMVYLKICQYDSPKKCLSFSGKMGWPWPPPPSCVGPEQGLEIKYPISNIRK